MATPLALVWDLIGRDNASVTFDRVGASAVANAKRIDSMAVATERAGTAAAGQTSKFGVMTKALAGLAAVDVGVHLVHMAADFEYQMNRMVTAAGESQKNLKSVSDGVLNLMGATGTGAQDLERGLYQIESAGYHGAAALNILKVAAQGAKIENASLGSVANAVTSAMVDYHVKADDAASVVNTLIAATAHGKTTLEEMSIAFSKVGAAGAQAHVPMADLSAAIATMTMHGTDAAVAGTYLRQVIGQLEGGSARARLVMAGLGLDANKVALTLSSGPGGLAKAIGLLDTAITSHLTPSGLVAIDAFKKSSGSLSDFQKVLGNIPPSLVSTFSALANMTGGVKSLQGFLQLGGENLKTFEANTRAVNEAVAQGGRSVEGWTSTQRQLSVQLDMLRHGAEALGIRIGQALIPVVQNVIQWFQKTWQVVAPLAHEVGTVLVAAWNAALTVMHGVGKVLDSIGSFAKSNQGALMDLAHAVLATWAAFKGAVIVAGILKTVDGALLAAKVRMIAFADSFTAVAAGMKAMSWGAFTAGLAAVGVAIYAAGKAFDNWLNSDDPNRKLGSWTANVNTFRDALQASNGELTKAISLGIAKKLQDSGLADRAAAAGISLDDLTHAVAGNNSEFDGLIRRWQQSGQPAARTEFALAMLHTQYGIGADLAGKLNTVTGKLTTTTVGSANAAEHAAASAGRSSGAMNTAVADATQFTDQLAAAGRTANTAGDAFLAAMDTFGKSAGTAADRAAAIGATLKAANGDALSFAASMVGAASANSALVAGFQGDVDKIAGIRQQIADLYTAASKAPDGNSSVASAEMTATAVRISNLKGRIAELNAKIASGKLSASGLAAAHRSLATAQASLGVATARLATQQGNLSKAQNGGQVDAKQLATLQKQLADAYKNSEKAAINLNKGTIDFTKGGAPALVQQLQSIQDAATKAASAVFQHEVATKGAKTAADDAYRLYVTQTQGALDGEASKLGITNKQADKLAKTYFGIKNAGAVKMLIEQEGANPVLDVLTKIGRLLAKFTGQPWDIKIDADASALAKKLADINKILVTLPGGSNAAAGNNKLIGLLGARAEGGPVTAGVPYIVGEKRPEVFVPNTNGRIEPRVPVGRGNITIQKQELHVHYPEPGGLREALPNLMRVAAAQLGAP